MSKKELEQEEITKDEEIQEKTLDIINNLEKDKQELEEKLLRNQAELQNYKRRKDEETEKMIKYCHEDIIKEILPIIDNFERAIEMDDNNLSDEVSKFLEGFKMIYGSFANVLNAFGVKEIEALNKPFDPNYHQAVLTDELKDKENDIVLEVFQKGYLLNDRILRPAMVKVNINNKINEEKENDKNE